MSVLLSRTLLPLAERWSPSGRELAMMRALADAEGVLRLPLATRVEQVRTGAVKGRWVTARGAGDARGVLLYLHGGGYVFGSSRSHFGIARRLSRESGLAVFVLDYRLAPEHPFPAAADDARAAYEWLIESAPASHRIALAGDSAGGHLAAGLVTELVRAGRPLPAAVLLMSPALDLSGGPAIARSRVRPDPVLSTTYGKKCLDAYLAGTHPLHPRLAVLSAPTSAWPPVLVQVGDTECLIGDAEAITEAVRSAGGSCDLQVWPGQVHVFQTLARWLPEARAALRSGGLFLRAHVDGIPDTPLAAPSGAVHGDQGPPRVSGQ